MLIWDTGEYEVLPYHPNTVRQPETSSDDDEDSEETLPPSDHWRDHISDTPGHHSPWSAQSEQEKLHQSFQHVCTPLYPINP